MSDFQAIGTVTGALQKLLQADPAELHGVTVPDPSGTAIQLENVTNNITVGSPELMRTDNTKNQVNLFLYAVAPNGAWRNLALPPPGKAGDEQGLPLAINLSYLLTAYGQGDSDLAAHVLLGWALRRLHDAPVLAPDLLKQTERVRVVMQPLSVDELSKLWMMFKMPYSPAAAFGVEVLLIESIRQPRAALPVLSRGENDAGFPAQPNTGSPFPTVDALTVLGPPAAGGVRPRIDVPGRQPGVRLGQTLVLGGRNLAPAADAPVAAVRFLRPGEVQGVELAPAAQAPAGLRRGEVAVDLPDVAPNGPAWRAGLYAVSVVYRAAAGGAVVRESNAAPLALAPRVDQIDPPRQVVTTTTRTLVTITVVPPVAPGQSVVMLAAGRAVSAEPFAAATPTVDFDITGVPTGEYFIQIRVDGVESLLVQDYAAKQLAFDTQQRLEVP